MDPRQPRSDACRSTPDLLAARPNGELTRSDQALERHLRRCPTCRQTVERLSEAEAALHGQGGDLPPDDIRVAWLELVGQEEVAEVAVPAEAPTEGENGAGRGSGTLADEDREAREPVSQALGDLEASPESPPEMPTAAPSAPPTVRARARRGGLVGAAKRLASAARRQQ
jgi:hypothetical protein